MVTSHRDKSLTEFSDEILLVTSKEHLENGNAISPQFPVLVMTNILYAYYKQMDKQNKEAMHEYTLHTLRTPTI